MQRYNLADISYDEFYRKHIATYTPCIITGFINSSDCPKENFLKTATSDSINTYYIGNMRAEFTSYDKDMCNNDIIKGLENDSNVDLESYHRMWKHDKGTLTRWHYDGNGADVLNISLQGSKCFYLSRPGSYPNFPLSSFAIPYDFEEEYKVILKPGEMLYIPAFWYHKVLTLQDNTVNLNYMFFNKRPMYNERNIQLYTLHKMLKSSMCEQPVCEYMGKGPALSAILRGLIETLPLFIVFVLLRQFLISKYRYILDILLGCAVAILVFVPYFQTVSFGVCRLVGVFLGAWYVLYMSTMNLYPQ